MIEGLTKAEALQKSRDMWNTIADETEKEKKIFFKGDYFSLKKISEEEVPEALCYCCDYDQQHEGYCISCPLNFPKDRCGVVNCCISSSPYAEWYRATLKRDWESAAKYTREIANLPENPDCK